MGVTHLKAYRKITGAGIAAICDAFKLPADGVLTHRLVPSESTQQFKQLVNRNRGEAASPAAALLRRRTAPDRRRRTGRKRHPSAAFG
jgi:hypothetical protein